jgi:hypothetical protein
LAGGISSRAARANVSILIDRDQALTACCAAMNASGKNIPNRVRMWRNGKLLLQSVIFEYSDGLSGSQSRQRGKQSVQRVDGRKIGDAIDTLRPEMALESSYGALHFFRINTIDFSTIAVE